MNLIYVLFQHSIDAPIITLEDIQNKFECSETTAYKISKLIHAETIAELWPKIENIRESNWDKAKSIIVKDMKRKGFKPISTDIHAQVNGSPLSYTKIVYSMTGLGKER